MTNNKAAKLLERIITSHNVMLNALTLAMQHPGTATASKAYERMEKHKKRIQADYNALAKHLYD